MAKHLYVAFFTGMAGSSMGMFYIGDGVLAGADAGGLKYDGRVEEKPDGTLQAIVKFAVPAGTSLISGLTANQNHEFSVPVTFNPGFDDGHKVTRIDTPAGPVNARFERLRELP